MGWKLMIELPFFTLDLVRSIIQNFTIIATLILLYNFIPDTLLSRSKLAFSTGVGIIFGLAAALSIPALWQTTGGPVIGFNIILVPLAGFLGGPVSTVFVAGVLLLGSAVLGGSLSATDILTVMSGILLGSLFYVSRSWKWFPKSYGVQFLLLGTGVALIELCAFILTLAVQLSPVPQPGTPPPLVSILPFLVMSCGITVILGYIIRFIDRRKEAEKELRDHKDRLEGLVRERTSELRQANSLKKAVIESTADGIVVVDPEGLIRAYNEKGSLILNLPAQPSKDVQDAKTFTGITSALIEDPSGFSSLIALLPESAEQIVTTSLRFRNGRIYELYVHPQRIGDRSVGRVWSFHDLTEQRHAEEALAAINNKLILLSNITRHDIFNQMTALSGYLELLEMENQDRATPSHINAMKKSLETIRFQLEFTRDYQDLGLKKPGWQNVEPTFTKATESFVNPSIVFRCETGPVEIFADPMIGQVFHNLMDNSLRHGERISEIRLSIRKEEPDLLLIYEDNGVGVPPDEKEKIFLKGFGKHTGLGMFLIKEILSITGITIHENGIYQQGVRFEIRVPSGKFRFL